MSVRAVLEEFVGKNIHVVMSGLNTAMVGQLVAVGDGWFKMKTNVSNNHHFDMSKLNSFWPEE